MTRGLRPLYLAVLALVACSETPRIDIGGNYLPSLVMPPITNPNIDVLFVVDTSGSIADNQEAVAAQAKLALFGVIEQALHGTPDLHVGVITSDLGAGDLIQFGCNAPGDGGELQGEPQADIPCTGHVNAGERFIIDSKGAHDNDPRLRNYDGTLDGAFSCIIQQASGGCGFEQPFAALERALSGQVTVNEGFLRDEALLVVIFLTDEDDCSSSDGAIFDLDNPTFGAMDSFRCFENGVICDGDRPLDVGGKQACRPRPSPHLLDIEHVERSLLEAKHGDRSRIMVAAFAGRPEVSVYFDNNQYNAVVPGCGDFFTAPAVRLTALLDRFRPNAWFEDTCTADIETALSRTAGVIGDTTGARPCLHGNIRDLDVAQPGIQALCHVFAVEAPFTPEEERHELTACAEARFDEACYEFVADAEACGHTQSGLSVKVEPRMGSTVIGKHIIAECLLE